MIICITVPTLQKLQFPLLDRLENGRRVVKFIWKGEKLEIPKKEATNKAEDKYDEAKHNNLKTMMNLYVEILWEQFLPPLSQIHPKHMYHAKQCWKIFTTNIL